MPRFVLYRIGASSNLNNTCSIHIQNSCYICFQCNIVFFSVHLILFFTFELIFFLPFSEQNQSNKPNWYLSLIDTYLWLINWYLSFGVDFFQVFQLIHAKTVLEVSHYFGKIYLLNCLVGCLIFKSCPDIRVKLFV